MIKSFKFKFIITLFLIILSMSIFMPLKIFADGTSYLDPKQFDDSSYNQISSVKIPVDTPNNTVGGMITKFLGVILTIIRTLAVGWAILMAVSIATKYMSGSSQIKAQIKVDLPTYAIGAAILFGAAGILTLIQYFVDDVIVVK